jgi:hypothetical protein
VDGRRPVSLSVLRGALSPFFGTRFPGLGLHVCERRKALPGGVGDSALQSVAEVEGCFQRLPAVGVGQGLGDDRVQRCFEVPPEAACHSSAAPIRSIR